MKNPKSNTKPAKPNAIELPTTEQLALLAATLARSSNETPDLLTYAAMELWKSARERNLKPRDYWDSHPEGVAVPTHEQLAMLAIGLAKNIQDSPANLVKMAEAIWYEAGFKLEGDHFETYAKILFPPIFTSDDQNKSGNVSRDTFFKKVLPASKKHRTFDIARIGKAYIRSIYESHSKEDFSKDGLENISFDAFYKMWNAGNFESAEKHKEEFKWWYVEFVKQTRRAAGLKSAAKKNLLPNKKLKKKL